MDTYSYFLHEEDKDQAFVRFTTTEMAAKAMEELKGKQLGEKPLKMTPLAGKKANIMWAKIKVLLQQEENKSQKRASDNVDDGVEKKVKDE